MHYLSGHTWVFQHPLRHISLWNRCDHKFYSFKLLPNKIHEKNKPGNSTSLRTKINRQLIQYGVALCCVYMTVRVVTTIHSYFRFHTTTVRAITFVVTTSGWFLFIRHTIQVSHLPDYLFHSNKFKSIFVTPRSTQHNVFSLFALCASEPSHRQLCGLWMFKQLSELGE